jgi:hypothetical protein
MDNRARETPDLDPPGTPKWLDRGGPIPAAQGWFLVGSRDLGDRRFGPPPPKAPQSHARTDHIRGFSESRVIRPEELATSTSVNAARLPAGDRHAAIHALPRSRRYGHGGIFGPERAAIDAWAERATRTLLLISATCTIAKRDAILRPCTLSAFGASGGARAKTARAARRAQRSRRRCPKFRLALGSCDAFFTPQRAH